MICPRKLCWRIIVFFMTATAIGATTAQAGCYRTLGCTNADHLTDVGLVPLSCEDLDILRNSIFADNGYCFENPKYRRIFGNKACRYESSGDVPLNDIEHANISAIIAVEQEKGCR